MRVALLSKKVEKVTDRLRSWSLSDLSSEGDRAVVELVDQLVSSAVVQGEFIMANSRKCHHCHRTLDHPDHAGIGSGLNYCTLTHFELCPGGRETSMDWTGCPIESETEEMDKKSSNKVEQVKLRDGDDVSDDDDGNDDKEPVEASS